MIRQSISVTEPNDAWLNSLVESEEYSSKSEIVNDLIRRARSRHQAQIEKIRAELIKGEQSGICTQTPEEIREEIKKELRLNGKI